MQHVEKFIAVGGRAAAAARAVRVAEGKPHLVSEIGAQEVDEIGAVGTHRRDGLVLVLAEMIVKHIARAVAQHVGPVLPRRLRLERRVEKLGDPSRIEISVSRFQLLRSSQRPRSAAGGPAGFVALTSISLVIVLQPPTDELRVRTARQAPAAGCATSANQTAGGPAICPRDLAATPPSGEISVSSPPIGCSPATSTRRGAPRQGA